ncbi:MAG: allophycocyanin [Crocosphaera sp.]|jgi:hypothetical protein
MLTQLTKLAQECDGRYGSDTELQFLQNYLQEVAQRISIYKKIRDTEDKIIKQIEVKVKSKTPTAFHKNGQDFSSICERDRRHTMRFLATAMLFNEQDKLKNTLLWQSIIMDAFHDQNPSQMTYNMMAEVMTEDLSDEEIKLVAPALKLVQSILGSN